MIPDQRLIDSVLRRLVRDYPNFIEISTLDDLDTPETQRALFYLSEKGLVEPRHISDRDGQPREMLEAKITARGIEAVEGVREDASEGVTGVPLESDALRHFLKRTVQSSALPDATKQRAVERLTKFSDADVKALLVRLVQKVAERPEVVVQLIESTTT